MVDDIAIHGVLEAIIVRDLGDGTPFQILAGSNRNRANIAAGNQNIPAIVVRNITDAEAKVIIVGTNRLTRNEDKQLPSERAYAYKMLHEVEMELRQEAKRTGRILGDNIGEIIGEQSNTSRAMFYRYIALTNLIAELMDLVDDNKIPLRAGIYLSKIDEESQNIVLSVLTEQDGIKIDEKKRLKLLNCLMMTA